MFIKYTGEVDSSHSNDTEGLAEFMEYTADIYLSIADYAGLLAVAMEKIFS